MTLLGAVCSQYPDAQLAIIFLPFFTFSAKSVNLPFPRLGNLDAKTNDDILISRLLSVWCPLIFLAR